MRPMVRSSVTAIALLAGAAALPSEPAVMRGLALETTGGRIEIGAVRTSLWGAVWAQSADSFSLENVTLRVGSASYQMGRIDVSGAASSRGEIEAVFNGSSTESLADRLGRIGARQIAIPELVAEQVLGDATQRTTYRNVTATDIVGGRIASLAADTAAQEMIQGAAKAMLTQGRTTLSDLDLAALARLYLDKAGSQPGPMTRIYSAFSIADSTITDAGGTVIRIARMTGRDFLARPTQDSWSGTVSLLAAMGEMDTISSQDGTRLIAAVTDLIDAMDIGTMEAAGIDVAAPGKEGRGRGEAHIERIVYASGGNGRPSDVRLTGFTAGGVDGRVKIDTVSLTGFSFRPTIAGLKSLRGKSLEDIDPALLRTLMPILGTLHVSGFDVDVPNEAGEPGKPQRVKASLKDFELTADKPVNGVPTNVRLGAQNLAMSLPEKSEEDGIRDLIELGYKDIDVSFLFAGEWNEAANEIDIRTLSFQGRDMGDVALKGTLSEVSRDVFNPDTALASVALMAAKVKSLDLVLENKGLFDRYLAREARAQRTKPENLRRTYGTAATLLIPSMIGNSDQAKAISQAVSRFIAKPGKLTISAQARNPAGLGLADVAAQPEPGAILEMLDVKAKAE